ncbi:hypothetical protein OEZ86_014567 [Tetradesmus obliquus]|nr:hypothetical protein OEZ86_014567 [Tetradesmus obliquus]
MAAVVTKPFLQRGGTVIYAACFASQTCSADVDAAFKAMGLMWRHGSYYRSDFYPTAAVSSRFSSSSSSSSSLPLPSRYNSKAVLLQHVHPEHRCYCPTKRSLIQSPVHPAVPVEDLSEAAVAFAPIGSNGWVGYIGSVSSTLDTSAIVLAMVHWASRQQQV